MQYNDTTQAIIDRLENNSTDYQVFEHEPVTTSEEASEVRGGYDLSQGLKALVLKLYDAPEQFVMIVVPGDTNFDEKKVKKATGANDFRFANEDELDDLLGEVKVGGIPPFGSLFELRTYVGESIKELDEVIFNAGDRSVSVSVTASSYFKSESPEVVDIT
jgi:Ala-tRNA(Pro) deacylase